MANAYNNLLKDNEGITLPIEKPWAKNVYWMNAIVLDKNKFGTDRDQLMQKLLEAGIQTRCFFVGMNKQPSLKKYGCDCSGNYPVSDFLTDNGLYLPSSSNLSSDDISFICNKIYSYSKFF